MKKIICITLSFLWLCFLTSCSSDSSVYFAADTVCYDVIQESSKNEFSFNMTLLSSKKHPKIEFESADGVQTEHLEVSFTEDTFDCLSEKIDGKYVILLGVHCTTPYEYTEIHSMQWIVEGEKKKFEFRHPVKNTFIRDENDTRTHAISPYHMPVYVFPETFFGGRAETEYNFSLNINQDIEFLSFDFNAWLAFSEDTTVYVNNELQGKMKDVLPISLQTGDVLSFVGKIDTEDKTLTGMENLYVDIVAKYRSDTGEHEEYYPISIIYIGNREDAAAFVKWAKEQ